MRRSRLNTQKSFQEFLLLLVSHKPSLMSCQWLPASHLAGEGRLVVQNRLPRRQGKVPPGTHSLFLFLLEMEEPRVQPRLDHMPTCMTRGMDPTLGQPIRTIQFKCTKRAFLPKKKGKES